MVLKSRWPVVLGTLTAVFSLLAAAHIAFWYRLVPERTWRQVEIVWPYSDVAELAARKGVARADVLERLKTAGVTALLVEESTVGQLVENGRLLLFPAPWDGSSKSMMGPGPSWLLTPEPELKRQLQEILTAQGMKVQERSLPSFPGYFGLVVAAEPSVLYSVPAGIDYRALAEAETGGLGLYLRLRSEPGVVSLDVPGLRAVGFAESQLPGYPFSLNRWRDIFQRQHLPLLQVEFFSQPGLNTIAPVNGYRVIRLHGVGRDELSKLSTDRIIDRYLLAVRERNVRAVVVNYLPGHSDIELTAALAEALRQEGFQVGAASLPPFKPEEKLFYFYVWGAGLGPITLLTFLGMRWRGKNLQIFFPLGLILVLIWTAALYFYPEIGRWLAALVTACVFPVAAVVWALGDKRSFTPQQAVYRLWGATAFSWAGGLLAAALLTHPLYMLQLVPFRGVKISYLLPLLLVAVWVLSREWTREPAQLRVKINTLLGSPVTLGWLLATFLVGAALLLYLWRSGNEGVILVSTWELKMRIWLENFLGVRPRTKEFLIGHPLLIYLLYSGLRGSRALPLLLLAAAGQVSVLNTYLHLHTPLVVSLLRTFDGLVLGSIAGLLLMVLLSYGRRMVTRI